MKAGRSWTRLLSNQGLGSRHTCLKVMKNNPDSMACSVRILLSFLSGSMACSGLSSACTFAQISNLHKMA
jgi:hypothetical protein